MPKQSDFVPSGFVVLRTPLLPFDDLLRQAGREQLRELVRRPEVREAIFVASPTLHDLIDVWLDEPDSERGVQCERALVRYAARMAGRATPFGLFAGVSTVEIADETRLVLDDRSTYRRTTRLDAGYLVDVLDALLADPSFRDGQTFEPNASLYRIGERWRSIRSAPGATQERHLLVSVRDSPALAATLDAAADGITPKDVGAVLVAAGHDDARIERYVADLIERQVLVPRLGLRVTGGDATYGLGDAIPALADAERELAELDRAPLGVNAERYGRITSLLEALPAEAATGRVLQVDLAKASPDATLGRQVVDEIRAGAELLWRVAYRDRRETPLARFADRCTARYEGEPVPLLEVLDPDVGVGFDDEPPAAPLLDGLGPDGAPTLRWGGRESNLLERLQPLWADGAHELVLDAGDLERLAADDAPALPDAFEVRASVAAPSETALASGRFRVLMLTVDGPSGARLLGRFCHADAALQERVEEHLRAEEALDPEAVFAEIVHLPRARDANVVARPVLRRYEIECLARSGAPPVQRIPLDDLLVSVLDGRVELTSRRLGRRVVPRLTTAHNYAMRGPAIYRFLCALQQQAGVSGDDFWGPLTGAPFLPRVRHGRVVLASASWRVEAAAISDVEAWREKHGVPRFVALVDYGGQLPVDLDNPLAVDSFVNTVRRRGTASVVEFFPPPDELVVRSAEGSFAHELVVPFVRNPPPATRTQPAPGQTPTVRRRFPPESEWAYVRLYTGETVADAVLSETVGSRVRDASPDRWFFLRYADPEFHLRVRLRGATLAQVDDPRVWRVELGTYQREVERYGGGAAIELVEGVFHADSEAVLDALPLFGSNAAGQEERWRLALLGVHRLLGDFSFDDADRLALLRRQRDGLARQLRWSASVLGRVGKRFREHRAELTELLAAGAETGHPLGPGIAILAARSDRIVPIAAELERLEQSGHLTRPRTAIASGLVHMHLNRLLRGANTAQELVICDFLARLYEARRYRAR